MEMIVPIPASLGICYLIWQAITGWMWDKR